MMGTFFEKTTATLDQPICPLLKKGNLAEAAKKSDLCVDDNITLAHLASFSSSIDWSEGYEDAGIGNSSVQTMLFADGVEDGMTRHILGHKRMQDYSPGEIMSYSSGDAVLLSRALYDGYKTEYKKMLPQFNKTLKTNIVFGRTDGNTGGDAERGIDEEGPVVMVSSSFLHISAKDLLAVGNLILNRGKVGSKQVVSESWLKKLIKPHSSFQKNVVKNSAVTGLSWYVNKAVTENNIKQAWPFLPEDTIAAMGHWGQILLVIPSWKVVAVRFGYDVESKGESLRAGELGWAIGKQLGKIDEDKPEPDFTLTGMEETFRAVSTKKFNLFQSRFTISSAAVGTGGGAFLGCACHFIAKQPLEYCEKRVKRAESSLSLVAAKDATSIKATITKAFIPVASATADYYPATAASPEKCVLRTKLN